jgi:hypothetical protein
VTDLVTLGSPLAYSRLLLADGPGKFEEKVKLRELPICPPDRSTTANRGYYTVQLSAEAVPFGDDYEIVHHAAQFALTRWTNCHLINDPVGYRLDVFGGGVRDIQILDADSPSMFKAHTSYWADGACDAKWSRALHDAMLAIVKEPECERSGR